MATRFDVVVVGGTPGGVMAAVAAARRGRTVALLERSAHIGGLPANGLGATDIATRGATGGLFVEFTQRIHAYYLETYSADSPQVKDASDGYHFEPKVAEQIFETLLAEQPAITVLRRRQFDALPKNVTLDGTRLTAIRVTDLESSSEEAYAAEVFIDATYEGDLAGAAGAPWETRREGKDEYNEPCAGVVYKPWGGPPGPGSSGEGDDTIQAYNYRLCLTRDKNNQVPIEKPATYDRAEYVSLIDDVKENRTTGKKVPEGIWRLTNMVTLPNGKTDANNQHLAFISTDLPVENYPWPTADWAWRDKFAQRLRDYTLGLFWFAQHDEELPADFRAAVSEWGLAKDEYEDNGCFPRQVYVREGRRITGEHLFTGVDAQSVDGDGGRPPLYDRSITASHYPLDSHAVRKREPGRVHLDGFFSHMSKPYTVPYGVMVPKKIDGLLVPVPASSTHVGFSTLRMEPCWMALGQAAGLAAAQAVDKKITPRAVDIAALQDALLDEKAVLIYFKDTPSTHPHFRALQYWGLKGLLPEWEARPDEPVDEIDARAWAEKSGVPADSTPNAAGLTRGAYLHALYAAARKA